jgi:hypothetical protein
VTIRSLCGEFSPQLNWCRRAVGQSDGSVSRSSQSRSGVTHVRVGLYRLYKGYVEVEASTRVKTVEPPL